MNKSRWVALTIVFGSPECNIRGRREDNGG